MKRNILVFPCGSEIGLEIHNSLAYSTYFNLIGASSVDDHGKFVYKNYIPNIPFISDEQFIPCLKKIIKDNKIDAVYPAMDSVIEILKKHEEELGCYVVSPNYETTEICLSKEKTYQILDGVVNTPRIYSFCDDNIEYPVFVKPKIGYGAKGTKIIHNRSDLVSFIKNPDDVLISELLPGDEYTIDCFTDRKGELLYYSARTRNRIRNGISVNTSPAPNQEEFAEIVNNINSKIQFRGAWFVQVKRKGNGELCLMEIAARFGGSSGLSRAMGVNFAMLTLFDAFEYNVKVVKNDYSVEMDRSLNNCFKIDIQYDTVYVDYDDCLILGKQFVNSKLVAFLYECINKNKKIILLTKHDGDLERRLIDFRLSNLFDEIIHIEKNDDKSNYIKQKNSIFIDDSFAERINVKEKCLIPVFVVDIK